ncbi:uncharacterized protein LOC111890364 [Lactuca sativa]|uniref:uncharacterized protein LOC111890364 n=1 Tax=Lactuca sativa TaxID=4236 RepID=UPI0022AF29FB|nr:uncharacterized protein LOC111890364 [Lactuca sativa]
MVTTRRFEIGSRSESGADSQGGPALSEDRIREIIHEEVVTIVWGQIPKMFGSIKTTMMEFFDDRYAAIAETADAAAVADASVRTGQVFQYRDLDITNPPTFDGFHDPITTMRWLFDVEGLQEYLDLRQGSETVTEITKMFMERAMFHPEFAASKQAQMTRYLSMLKTEIRQFVSTQHYGLLLEMQEASRQCEIEIDLQTKELRLALTQLQPTPKWFKTTNVRSGGRKGRTCEKCGKVREGACRSSSGCYKCGRQGHMARDCRHQAPLLSSMICYRYDQVGHVKANYSSLAARPAQAPAPTTLMIIDGSQGRTEPPRARGRAFQLTAWEASATQNVVTGKFRVKSIPALALFDSGVSWSFVSRSFSREFALPIGDLEYPLRVSITNEHGVSDSSIYQGCVLEIFRVSVLINLIPIPMRYACIIVGMDWMRRFGAMINCEGQRVDTRVGDHVSAVVVFVVREFADVFLEELPGVPPERQGYVLD